MSDHTRGFPRTATRAAIIAVAGAVALTGTAAPASAQTIQSVSFGIGVFTPRAYDSRVEGDVWVADLSQPIIEGTDPPSTSSLDFRIRQFRSAPVFGEWNIAFGDHVEVSVGASYANKKVHSRYLDLIDSHGTPTPTDDTEIEQDLRLRTIPIQGIVRFLGGRTGGVQPYVGGGVMAVVYRYSEIGQFVDLSDFAVFNGRYVTNGTAVGAVLVGGLRLPIGGDIYALTIEGRYRWAVGSTPGLPDFLGDKIDLSGGGVNFGFLIRY